MRTHLASLLDDFSANATETAVVSHRGVRSYRTTYGQIAELAGRFSSELQRRSIAPGDRVLLWGDNSAAWIAAFFGCMLRGVLAVPLDVSGSPAFAERILGETTPRLIVGDAKLLSSLSTPTPKLNLATLHTVLPSEPNFQVDPAVREDTTFQIIFTSGTTSEPKGIVHTHRNVLASLRPIEAEIAKYRRYERWVHPLRFLHTLPLSHVFGQFMGLWLPGVLGAELHFTDALEPARTIELIRRERVSVLVAVPRILGLLRTHLLATDPSLADDLARSAGLSVWQRWRRFRRVHRALGWKFWAVIAGGASLPAELESFWNRLGFALIQGYGMTETAALVTLNHPFRIGQGTIGKALPGREVRLSDTGELLVRGDMVAGATWQDGRMQHREDAWLHTGDLAEQNEAGEFRFVGRKGDAIVTSSGLNIHPADLETAMLRQPGVQACVVVSCDLPNGPEPVCVVVSALDDTALQSATQQANRALADYQQLRRVLRWPDLAFPYTSTGKLLRRSIREWACQQFVSGTAHPTTQVPDSLLAAIGQITGEAMPVGASDSLRLSEDLRLDSLARVQLAAAVEQQTGAAISDAEIASLQTLGDLRVAVAARSSTFAFNQQNLVDSLAPAGLVASPDTRDAASPESANDMRFVSAEPEPGAVTRPSTRPNASAGPAIAYPRWPWSAPVRLLRAAFLELIARPLIRVLLAPRVTDVKQPPNTPVLIVANHVTALDGALVLYALPTQMRRCVAIMMSGEMLADFRSGRQYGLAGRAAYWLLTALFNVFPLPRLQGFRQSFEHAGQALNHSYSVLIFPEGTRSHTGTMAPFRPGIGLLAVQARVPVLPVALLGLDRMRARGAHWFRSGELAIRVGDPIPWTEAKSATEWTAELERHLRALL